jgi:hypothetical protein
MKNFNIKCFFDPFLKGVIIGSLVFFLFLHIYIAILLYLGGIFPELIWPTLIFCLMASGGAGLLIFFGEKQNRSPIIAWLGYVVALIIDVFEWSWELGYFDEFNYTYTFFPTSIILIIIWGFLLVVAVFYTIGIGITGLIRFFKKQIIITLNPNKTQRILTLLTVLIPILLFGLSETTANWYSNEGVVKSTIIIKDENHNCSLSMWDEPKILDAQIGNTTEIDLTKLSDEENRTLIAFAKMNTTFYGYKSYKTEILANRTIAYMKMLDAFNLTMIFTIFYENHAGFPIAMWPEDWINHARKTLEFFIVNNITNAIGITADSEGSANVTADEYDRNIAIYDEFLKEVQTNTSLRHPDPARKTFDVVLTFEHRALMDYMDGDQDIIRGQRKLGMPPESWTHYHFMLYRMANSDGPIWLLNFLTLMKNNMNLATSAPIVGLTGLQWFAEGYFNGTNEHFHWDPQDKLYDCVDGWEAMRREIILGKAMGFYSVSVFHLRSYGTEGTIEYTGFLDYYGIDALEELAIIWDAETSIEIPVTSTSIRLSQRGFFNPNEDFKYDVLTNLEMVGLQLVILLLITLLAIKKAIKPNDEKTIEKIEHK